MSNYPQYQYQMQQMGYQPQMMPIYPQQYQQQAQQMPQDGQLYCRMVASEEEARGAPVDFNGKPQVFTQLNAGWVYVKAFDQVSGGAIFERFKRYEEPPKETAQQPAAMYAPMGVVEQIRALETQVATLQEEIKGLRRRRAQSAEVKENED